MWRKQLTDRKACRIITNKQVNKETGGESDREKRQTEHRNKTDKFTVRMSSDVSCWSSISVSVFFTQVNILSLSRLNATGIFLKKTHGPTTKIKKLNKKKLASKTCKTYFLKINSWDRNQILCLGTRKGCVFVYIINSWLIRAVMF